MFRSVAFLGVQAWRRTAYSKSSRIQLVYGNVDAVEVVVIVVPAGDGVTLHLFSLPNGGVAPIELPAHESEAETA